MCNNYDMAKVLPASWPNPAIRGRQVWMRSIIRSCKQSTKRNDLVMWFSMFFATQNIFNSVIIGRVRVIHGSLLM